jgi:16S rRNA processing protein RimM
MARPKRNNNPFREDEVVLGYVSGVFGIRGEVKVFLHNRDSHLLGGKRDVVLVRSDGVRSILALKVRSGAGKRLIGKFEGVDSRELAEAMQGALFGVALAALPELGPDEFYLRDVIGLPVYVDGVEVGKVCDIHQTSAHDVLEVAMDDETEFVPIRPELVDIDVAGGRVDVDRDALS